MNATFAKIVTLVAARDVRVSAHGLKRLQTKLIALSDLIDGIGIAEVIEDYPDYYAGPAVLVLYSGRPPYHAVWGFELGTDRPAVLITAYAPDPAGWSADFRRRKR